jgi:hypothetical protein
MGCPSQKLHWPTTSEVSRAHARHVRDQNCDDLADAGLILHATEGIVERTIKASVEETWKAPRNTQAATALVRAVCDRFTIVANALAERHDNRATNSVTDEYDVHDPMGALLKLHFTDVRPEEWTPSYAGNASRMDFCLSLNTLLSKQRCKELGWSDPKTGDGTAGNHAFRRFRNTFLRKGHVPDDLIQFWLGHAGKSMTDEYLQVRDDLKYRKMVAEQVGTGFEIPIQIPSIVPNVPKSGFAGEVEVAVNYSEVS